MSSAWWDEVQYTKDEVQPLWTMQIDAPVQFAHPCGFIRLRERHRVKAIGVPVPPNEKEGEA